MKKIFFVLVSFLVFLFAPDCKPASAPAGSDGGLSVAAFEEAGIAVADGACTLFMGIDSSGVMTTICATIEEIGQIAAFILTLRHVNDAGPYADERGCMTLPYTRVCVSEGELSKGIAYVVSQRRAALLRDAGADAR